MVSFLEHCFVQCTVRFIELHRSSHCTQREEHKRHQQNTASRCTEIEAVIAYNIYISTVGDNLGTNQ